MTKREYLVQKSCVKPSCQNLQELINKEKQTEAERRKMKFKGSKIPNAK